MSYLKNILEEEHQRLQSLSGKYQNAILSFPRGSICIKKRRQKEYLYLAYRENRKVKFKYIGPGNSEKAENVIKKIELRKNYEDKLKQVKKDLAEIEKVFHGKKV
ncbi:Uncharacterized protein dnl_49870 [Desulfonema limicola]|uniref:DUF6788 domain-containing protein n=1 Tax=Desulfonema limicola TaxID=45656 RepID=A0A975BBG7_9BACT|nr:hypothetical protein [Desulfonema limicola]QTA82609.1 Uncharacterized protein dnl_49870 [Desulfonema limicola]